MCLAANQPSPVPSPVGLEYLPYQLEGIEFARDRQATLLGDKPGLGKTIQAIGFLNCHTEMESALVVCPATGLINWRRELDKWLIDPTMDVTVTNYEQLGRLDFDRRWDTIILDEAHYIKSQEAQRSLLCKKLQGDRRLALTGTPMLNDRPIEMWSLLNWLRPDVFTESRRRSYEVTYCNAHVATKAIKRRNGTIITKQVWDNQGASNLGQFRQNLRKHLMIRRSAEEVLPDLPPKRRQLIELSSCGLDRELRRQLADANRHMDSIEETFGDDVSRLANELRVAWSDMSKLRHDVGMAKAELGLEVIHNALEASGKVVLFAYHRDVVENLANSLVDYNPVILYGGMSARSKQSSIDSFQNNPKTRVFVGQLEAAGTIITLTAAHHEVFVETDWTPGAIDQAEDRCRRIGQKSFVLAQHLALENSLDARMFKLQERKRKDINKALDA